MTSGSFSHTYLLLPGGVYNPVIAIGFVIHSFIPRLRLDVVDNCRTVTNQFKPVLERLRTDADVDVQYYAQHALALI